MYQLQNQKLGLVHHGGRKLDWQVDISVSTRKMDERSIRAEINNQDGICGQEGFSIPAAVMTSVDAIDAG